MRTAITNVVRAGAGLALSLAALAGPAWAEPEWRGRVELGFSQAASPADFAISAFGGQSYSGQTGSARVMLTDQWGGWDVEMHYRLDMLAGQAVGVQGAAAALASPPPPYTLLDLSGTLIDTPSLQVSHGIDRLSFARTTPQTVLRIGRQALTWGAGMAFHPMDLVAPFAPQARDTEFKPGVDMVYFQYLFDNGADIELIGVPRAQRQGGPIDADASTLGARYRTELWALNGSLVLARDRGDTTAGLGLGGPLGGATWNVELVPTWTASGQSHLSGLANISFALPMLGRTPLVFAEYYRNGFGVARKGPAYDSLPADLTNRLARGQVYTVGQDYLAMGMSSDLSPLTSIATSTLVNLADRSTLSSVELNVSLSDNANLMIGAQLPRGGRGTEFGGLPASGAGAPYIGPERNVYMLFRTYF